MSRAARQRAELAAARAQAAASAYRRSFEGLQSRLRRDWRVPLAFGFGGGALAGMLPVAASVRAGSALLRMVVSLSRVPYGALARLARNAAGADDSSPD